MCLPLYIATPFLGIYLKDMPNNIKIHYSTICNCLQSPVLPYIGERLKTVVQTHNRVLHICLKKKQNEKDSINQYKLMFRI